MPLLWFFGRTIRRLSLVWGTIIVTRVILRSLDSTQKQQKNLSDSLTHQHESIRGNDPAVVVAVRPTTTINITIDDTSTDHHGNATTEPCSLATPDNNGNELRIHVQAILESLHAPTHVNIPDDYTGDISNLWTCHQPPSPDKKLVFIHIFKTAGTSFRKFLDEYAQKCHRGYTLLTHCSQVLVDSMTNDTTPWTGPNKEPCINKFSRHRTNSTIWNEMGNVTGQFLRYQTDILMGHFPIGVHRYWKQDNNNHRHDHAFAKAQYVAFFRDPVAKYISGRLFENRHKPWTRNFGQAVNVLKAEVTAARKRGDYSLQVDNYLTTPEQKNHINNGTRTLEERVNIVRENLLAHKCAVGIVERMKDSLALVQHVVDGNLKLTRELRRLDIATAPRRKRILHNKSSLSTTNLLAALQKDEEFYPTLLEYLKYEFWVYDYALQIHARQIQKLRLRYGSKYKV